MVEPVEDDEPPTNPDLSKVRCPSCFGDVRRECDDCGGTGKVTREAFTAWHARAQGRPKR